MNLRINKLIFTFTIINTSLHIHCLLAFAKGKDNSIYIESEIQSISMCNNTLVFSGNVILNYRTIKINADRIIITHFNDKYSEEVIDGYGNLITFYQVKNSNKIIKGYAYHIHYEPIKGYLILIGNVHLKQSGNNITGDKIIYSINDQKIRVFSKKGKKITIILSPLQLQNKIKKMH